MLFTLGFLLLVTFAAEGKTLLEQASPVLDVIEKLPHLLQRSRSQIPLRVALGVPDAVELDVLETEFRNNLGQIIREELTNKLKNIETRTSEAGQRLSDLNGTLTDIPSEETVKKFIDQIYKLEDKREIIGYSVTNKFDETALQIVTWNAIESRGIKEWWEKVKNWFKGLGTKISNKFKQFKEWAMNIFDKIMHAAKPLLDQIKQLALEFLKQNWEKLTVEIVKQALSFFDPYLGKLGAEITQKLIELARHFNLIPWEKMLLLL